MRPRIRACRTGILATTVLSLLAFSCPPFAQNRGAEPGQAVSYFAITVVDRDTGRGVPLVELRTVHGIRQYTDSNGVVTFHEPGLMGKDVFFHVSSHGYEFPKDGFGYRGKALRAVPGGSAKLEIRRVNLAERLYRVTGGGIYRDSILAGMKVPQREPVLNAQVLGSDSVLNAVYQGKLTWFWGDTNRPAYPLGNFHVPGATSELPSRGGLDPETGIDLHYFTDPKGFAKPTMQMPGKGPTWMTSLVPLRDKEGRERLYASFVKVEPPLKVYARGLAVFDDAKQEFVKLADVDMKSPVFPEGHTFRGPDAGDRGNYVYFAHPFPTTRVRATAEDFLRIENYESFTCLKDGTRLKDAQFDCDSQGRLRYAWRKNTPALSPSEEKQLLAAGTLKPAEARWQLRDGDTGKPVLAHSGSVYFNEFRQRWVMITVESGGTSYLGEVWYAEADSPVGPWAYAVKVVTHDRYSFYNPKQHPSFDKDQGRVIFFEGTYTHTFSGNPDATPRYDYNQVLYKLNLADPRLAMPVAVYDLGPDAPPTALSMIRALRGKATRPAFFAPDRPLPGTVPVVAEAGALRVGQPGNRDALFHALPADTKPPPATTTPLYEYRQRGGTGRAYSVDPALALPGYERGAPVCLVWRTAG